MLEKSKKNLYLMYSALFLLIWGIITLPFVLRGNSLIGQADSFNQSFPVFVYVGEYIRELFRGNLTMFDFRLGLGDDVITTLNVHGLGDVFQIISAFVGKEHAEAAYEIVMVLKYYFCGISFSIYCRGYIQNVYYQIIGALLYVFSVFSLFFGLNCWMFLNSMITLPLILHGINQLMESQKKISFVMIVALFIQALNGFYYLYMEIIIAIIYVSLILIVRLRQHKITFKYAALRGMVIAGHGLLGISLGAVLFIPSVIGFLTSSRTGDVMLNKSIISAFIFDDYKYYIQSLSDLFIPNVYISIITIPVIMLLGVIIFLISSESKTEVKVLVAFWGIAFWIPFMGNLMNGFSYWTERWYFSVLLFLILGTVLAIEQREKAKKNEVILFEIISITSIAVHILISDKTIGLIFQTAIFVFEIVMVPFLWNRKNAKIFVCLTVTILIINGLLTFGPKILGGSGYSAGFQKKGESYKEISESVKNIEKADNSFQRWDIYESSLSSSLIMDYYGTTEYFSMLNSYVSEFFQEMYISPGVRSATWILKGLDGRREIESLLSTTQYMDFKTNDKGQASPFICETKEVLPLGFLYDQYMTREEFNRLNAIERSSAMLECIVVDEMNEKTAGMKKVTADDILEHGEDREVDIQLAATGLKYDGSQFTTDDEARIRVYLQSVKPKIDEGIECYVKLSNFCLLDEGTQDVYVGNKNIQLRNKEDNYYIGNDEFWVHVSEVKEDEEGTYFDIFFDGNKSYTLENIQVYLHLVNRDAITDRKANTFQDLKIGMNKIEGKVVIDEDAPQALFLSVPYSIGWKAYVDGKETEIVRTNIAFMSVCLEEGEHEIAFRYSTPGLKVGGGISILAVTTMGIIVYTVYRRRKMIQVSLMELK